MRTVVLVGSIIASFLLLSSFFVSGAAQQAALAAMACAFCVIPYVVFRTAELRDAHKTRRDFYALMQKRMEELIEVQRADQQPL
ncbi:hypothetical protein PSQ39_06560 [Curvibacter sp. HBC28]|uniref:GGDEF domain-containing protein n=1 Tax=Curvibacter microcysteis TaxID=3026419 RepID=A0ABT5MCJ7_9BURK|nr:hypothetical protein [Curvibacter sp. HBC28]MDD0814288.1 hypothetical protein [Curvibacter sp. HBC28]